MKKQKEVLPITKKRFEELVSSWAKIINYEESGSFYYYSKADLLRRLNQLIADKKTYKKYFNNQKMALVDAENFILEDQEDWREYFMEKGGFDAYFICGLDSALIEKNNNFFLCLHQKAKALKKPFLFFFSLDFSHPQFTEIFKDKTSFTQNTVFHSLHDKESTWQFIRYLENKWQLNLGRRRTEQIAGQCGNHFLFVKQAVRYLRDYSKAQINKALFHEQMAWKCHLVWSKFLKTEQEVIKKILKNSDSYTAEEKHSLTFLQNVRFITKKGKKYSLSIPLLEDYIRKTQLHLSLSLDRQKQILANGVPVAKTFSKNEKAILQLFIVNKNKEVSREQIAEVLWMDNWEDKYSDWAIDQIVSRLRKKLIALGIDAKTIKTLRKKGFLYQSY